MNKGLLFKIVIFIILTNLPCCVLLAGDTDSLRTSYTSDSNKAAVLSAHAFSLAETNPDSSLLLSQAAINIALQSNNIACYASCLRIAGIAYFRSGKYDSAQKYFLSARRIFHKIHDTLGEVKVLESLSSMSSHEEDYQSALNQLSAAIQLMGTTKEAEYPFIELMMGMIYNNESEHAKAKMYLKNAADDFLKINDQKSYADAICDLGNVYFALANTDSAIYCYRIALNIYSRSNSEVKTAVMYENLGDAFLTKNGEKITPWLDTSLLYYQHAYDLYSGLKNIQDFAVVKIHMSEALIKKKKFTLAKKYLPEALAVFQSQRKTYYNYITLTLLSRLYNEMHMYNKAYDFLAKANLYTDTLNEENKTKAMADMLAKYEAEKKDKTITLLNTQNTFLKSQKKLADHNLYKTRIIELFCLVVIALSVFLGFLLMNRYRINQKLNEMQMRNRISNDLHDDVGSSLSSILLLSNIAGRSAIHRPELVNKISENAREAIERIGDIIWSTNPKYDDGENLRPKIMNYIAPLCQVQDIGFHINISETIKNIKFSMEMRKNIFLIIKEAVNNILKHAQATEINIEIILNEKNILLQICDNGIGFDNSVTYNGNGLENMRMRAEALSGKLRLETGIGTKISIVFPVPGMPLFSEKTETKL